MFKKLNMLSSILKEVNKAIERKHLVLMLKILIKSKFSSLTYASIKMKTSKRQSSILNRSKYRIFKDTLSMEEIMFKKKQALRFA